MEAEFSASWEMIVVMVAVIVMAGSVLAIVFRRMQNRLKNGG